jgi:phage terminase large subunit GpA-like protein
MDAVNHNEIVVVMSSAQVGKSEVGLNTAAYFMHHEPSPILVLNPTLEMAETWSKDRLSPMVRDSPVLKGLIDPRARASGNTLLHKNFPGGHITLAGANSAASLASRPIRVIIADEVDRYPFSAGNEGDPLALAVKRTTTFWNRRVLMVSTPTVKGASRIEFWFEKSDQRRYFVPCPHCGQEQYLKWRQVQWEKNHPESAWYECEACRGKIQNGDKPEMLRRGKWVATAESNIAGFHLNELYSPWRKFGEVAADFIKAKDNPELLKVWTNTSLGESFEEEEGNQLEWHTLAARAEPYQVLTVPEGGLLLTAGVDVQADRLAVAIWAWGEGEESWLIYWIELYGDPEAEEVWKQLDLILDGDYHHALGFDLKITAAAIDTGFKPQAVYNYVRASTKNLFAIKGMSTPGRPILGSPTYQEVNYKGQKVKKGIRLWPIGVDVIKGILYGRLKITLKGAGYVHFPIGIPEEFYDQLTAEKQVTRYLKGYPKQEWIKVKKRNEALDIFVYAYAAAVGAGIARYNFKALLNSLLPKEEAPEASPEPPKKWINPNRGRGNFAQRW